MNQKEVMTIRDFALTNRDSVELFQSRGVSVEDLKELFRLALKGVSLERTETVRKFDVVSHDGARSALSRLVNPDKAVDQELKATLVTYIAQQEAKP